MGCGGSNQGKNRWRGVKSGKIGSDNSWKNVFGGKIGPNNRAVSRGYWVKKMWKINWSVSEQVGVNKLEKNPSGGKSGNKFGGS